MTELTFFLSLTMSRRTRPKPEGGIGGTFGIDTIIIDRCYEVLVRGNFIRGRKGESMDFASSVAV